MGISVGSIVMSRMSDKVSSRAFQMPVAVARYSWLAGVKARGRLQARILLLGVVRDEYGI